MSLMFPSDQNDFSLAVEIGFHFVGGGCCCGCRRGLGRYVVEDLEDFAHGLNGFGGVVCEGETGFETVDFGGGRGGGGWNARVPEEGSAARRRGGGRWWGGGVGW